MHDYAHPSMTVPASPIWGLPHPAAPYWLTRKEAAKYGRMHVNTLDRLIKAGRLPAYKIGRSVRIKRAELDAVLMAGCLK